MISQGFLGGSPLIRIWVTVLLTCSFLSICIKNISNFALALHLDAEQEAGFCQELLDLA